MIETGSVIEDVIMIENGGIGAEAPEIEAAEGAGHSGQLFSVRSMCLFLHPLTEKPNVLRYSVGGKERGQKRSRWGMEKRERM